MLSSLMEPKRHVIVQHKDDKFSSTALQYQLFEITAMFLDLKTKLETVKNKLDYLPLNKWHAHTKSRRCSEEIVFLLNMNIQPEYCSVGWCKMYELLSRYPQITSGCSSQLYSVHLSEVPGGFVSALNHYISTNFPKIKWDYTATGLNPCYEGWSTDFETKMQPLDSLILNQQHCWNFLLDKTGDLTCPKNFLQFLMEMKQSSYKQNVFLVTADGGLNCSLDPLNQEIAVMKLKFLETAAALSILGQGGSFVLKIFTFFEHQTVCLLYLLCTAFREVQFCKPTASKPGNSEVYVVCLDYKKNLGSSLDNWCIDLLQWLSSTPSTMLEKLPLPFKTMPVTVAKRILNAASMFVALQITCIELNIAAYEQTDTTDSRIFQRRIAESWIKQYNIVKLPPNARLNRQNFSSVHMSRKPTSNNVKTVSWKDYCFKELALDLSLSKTNEILAVSQECQRIRSINSPYVQHNFAIRKLKIKTTDFCLNFGKPYETLKSSVFCPRDFMLVFATVETASVAASRNKTKTSCFNCSPIVLKILSATVNSICLSKCVSNSVLLKTLKSMLNLKLRSSLFLCNFPLVSRLQVGFMYLISTFFDQVLICEGQKSCPRGILLQNFFGVNSPEEKSKLIKIATLVKQLPHEYANDMENCLLELVCLREILENCNTKGMENYNKTLAAWYMEEIKNIN